MNGSWLVVFLGCAMFSFFLSGMEAGVFALSRLRIRQFDAGRENPRAGRAVEISGAGPENFLWDDSGGEHAGKHRRVPASA
jgi:CBS domain containing-hemolysin-like protein